MFEVIEVIKDNSLLDAAERKYISQYMDSGKSYNISTGGSGGCGCTMSEDGKAILGAKNRQHMLGRKLSEETRKKMRESSKHQSLSQSHIEILRERMTGREVSQSTKGKLSRINSGEKSKFAKISACDAIEIKKTLISGLTSMETSKLLNYPYQTVNAIANNRTWKYTEVDGWEEYLNSKIK